MQTILVEPSPSFKRQARKAIIAISLYILAYLITLLFAAGVAVAFAYLGYYLIAVSPRFLTVIIGVAAALTGLTLLVVLLSAFFRKSKFKDPARREITAKNQPKLIALINEVAESVGAKKPHKVYLSPDLNAQVSFKSSFLSMFFPEKKDLTVGIPLIRMTTEEELKGILAHEFGHFSQSSMRLGSYVYHLNSVIYGIVQPNQKVADFFAKISGWNIIVWVLSQISFSLVQGTQ